MGNTIRVIGGEVHVIYIVHVSPDENIRDEEQAVEWALEQVLAGNVEYTTETDLCEVEWP